MSPVDGAVFVPPRGVDPRHGVPCTEFVELPDRGHVGLVLRHPGAHSRARRPGGPLREAWIFLDGADIGFIGLVAGRAPGEVPHRHAGRGGLEARRRARRTAENILWWKPDRRGPDFPFEQSRYAGLLLSPGPERRADRHDRCGHRRHRPAPGQPALERDHRGRVHGPAHRRRPGNEAGSPRPTSASPARAARDFLAGQAFSFVTTLDAVGAVPPIAESHVEMDGAWALYEAWVKLQMGDIDTALVYSYGKSVAGIAARRAGHPARPVLRGAAVARRLRPRCAPGPAHARVGDHHRAAHGRDRARSPQQRGEQCHAVRRGAVASTTCSPHPWSPIRCDPADLPAEADGGVAVVLAAGDRARSLAERPAWIRGIDHRIDAHNLGARDLTDGPVGARWPVPAQGSPPTRSISPSSTRPFTTPGASHRAGLGLGGDTAINPSGGALAGHTMMAAGLMRIAEAARRVARGDGDRAVAHATAAARCCNRIWCASWRVN